MATETEHKAGAERDPMDRLAVLEDSLAREQATNATLKADLSALRADLAKREEAEKAQRAAEQATYLLGIKKKAGKDYQSPIPPEDLDRVSAAFARGDDETAKILGDAFLERSRALGGHKPAGATTEPLGSSEELDLEGASAALVAAADNTSARRGPKWSK